MRTRYDVWPRFECRALRFDEQKAGLLLPGCVYSKFPQHVLQDGNVVSNEIRLALPMQESAALFRKLTLVDLTLNRSPNCGFEVVGPPPENRIASAIR